MSMRSVVTWAVVLGLAVAGCRQPKKLVLTTEQKERIEANLLKAAPEMKHPVGAELGEAIRLLGVDVDATTVKAGGKLEITYYWEVLKELHGDWKVFVHLEKSRQKRQILDHNAIGELYPIDRWKAGDIIRDVQRVTVDADFPAGPAELWIGVYDEGAWKSAQRNERLPVTAKGQARTDAESRVLGASLTIEKGAAPAAGDKPKAVVPAQALTLKKAAAAPTIDGTIADAEWANAVVTPLAWRPDARPYQGGGEASVRAQWDADNLYLAFQVKDADIASQFTARDDTLWKEDVVEVYLDPYGDEKDYLELQVAPTGAVFDAFFTEHRKPDWPEASKGFNVELKTAVALQGTLNDDKPDTGWTVEMAIPLKSIPNLKEGSPKAGEAWKANFYRLDVNPKGAAPSQAVWSPAGGDFHNLGRAGTLTFGE